MQQFQRPRLAHPDYSPYEYHLYTPPGAGAQEAVFEARFGLPLYSFRGIARLAGAPMVTQHPQLWQNKAVTPVGIGGPAAGQLVTQPVIYPDDNGQCCETICQQQ